MTRFRRLVVPVIACLIVAPTLSAGSGAKRWAGRGAAGGAILGLLVGGDLGSAAAGAAIGAAGGAAGGAISDSKKKKKAEKAELEELRQKEAEREAQAAASDLPQTEEEWIAAIGQDNVNALNALIECQYDRSALLAKAAGTSEDPEFRLVARWIEALVEVDRKDQAAAEKIMQDLIALDDDVDTVQQASLAADQAILEVRQARQDEGVTCTR